MFAGPPGLSFARLPGAPGITYAGGRTAREVRRCLRDGGAYRVAMSLPGIGPAALSFEATPGDTPAERHPVEVTVEAGAFAVPRALWNSAERAAAEERQASVLRYLEACCTELDPSYAVLHSEGSTPTPAALGVGRQIGTDVYLSRRLGLEPRLAQVRRLSETLERSTGSFHSGWFLTETSDLDALLAAWTRPSLLIAESLADRARR
jgi:hypothetical protein